MGYKVSVDKKKCIGCGNCVALCPETFEVKDGVSCVKQGHVEDLDCEKSAEELCPVQAIRVLKG